MYIAVVIAFLFYIISSVMDYVISHVGTQRGVADEGNGIITGLFGQKPSLLQYLLYALGEAVVLSLPALLFLITKPCADYRLRRFAWNSKKLRCS